MNTLGDLSASKLHPREQDVVREAADELFFCEKLEADAAAEQALAELSELLDRLVGNDRVLPETAEHLSAAVEACGRWCPCTPEVSARQEQGVRHGKQVSVRLLRAGRSGGR